MTAQEEKIGPFSDFNNHNHLRKEVKSGVSIFFADYYFRKKEKKFYCQLNLDDILREFFQ